jgi:hypothetical protein
MIGNCFFFKKDDNTKIKKNASFFWFLPGKERGRIVPGMNWEKSYVQYPNPNESEKKVLLFPYLLKNIFAENVKIIVIRYYTIHRENSTICPLFFVVLNLYKKKYDFSLVP